MKKGTGKKQGAGGREQGAGSREQEKVGSKEARKRRREEVEKV
jgi:hypothetical protein